MPIPERIRNAPALRMGLELYLTAWLDLSSCRSVGWAPGPIPWLAVEEYGRLMELDEETIQDLHYHVRALDNSYQKHVESKSDG